MTDPRSFVIVGQPGRGQGSGGAALGGLPAALTNPDVDLKSLGKPG